jgi:VWFA-related protein
MHLRSFRISIYILLTALLIPFIAYAQNQEDETTLRVGTELLQIDAVVTDKNGRVVENLTKEDFELLEEGVSQEIAFFSVIKGRRDIESKGITVGGRPLETGKATVSENPGRVIVLLVDDLHISIGNMVGVKKLLHNFITEQVQDGDRVAVVSTGGGLGYLQQLTTERRVMKAAVERLRPQPRKATSPSDPARLSEYQAQQILIGDREALNVGIDNYIYNTGIPDRATAERAVQSEARTVVSNLSFITGATLQTIKNAIQSMKGMPGRKSMFLVSDGFVLETREADHNREMRRIVDAATRSGVTIYALGSAGLVALDATGRDISEPGSFDPTGASLRLASRALTESTFAMSTLAEDTGGLVVINSNDLNAGLKRINSDSQFYYLIAYYPEKSRQDGKFHKLALRVKERKDLVIRTRKGYLAGEEESKTASKKKSKKDAPPTETVEISKALYSVLPMEAIGVKLTGSFFGSESGKENTVVSLAINLHDISFDKSTDRHKNILHTALLVISEDGKTVSSTEDKVELKFTEQNFAQASKGWFFFGKSLTLKPGLYNLRFAIRDPISGQLGSASQWLEIPDLSRQKITLSSILLSREDISDASNAGVTAAKQQSPSVSGVLAVRHYPEKSNLDFLAYVFNASSVELTSHVEILRNELPVFTSPITVKNPPDKLNRMICGARLSLEGFKPGRYVLKMTVTDKKSGARSTQEQDFTIE